MKAILDHVGIAVRDLQAALAFFRDGLGLEVHAPEEVVSQHVRAYFVPAGESALELLEATAPESPIARYVEKHGPGLHHMTLRVDDIASALDQLKHRGIRLIDDRPRPGAGGSTVAFIHPSSAHGVLVELKQAAGKPSRATEGSDMKVQIGIIGGSGLYDMAELTEREEVKMSTPFGEPSSPYVLGTLRGKRVAFLARHGAGHRILPTELNFRANIYGFKKLGVERLISASAVGSLKEEYRPLDIVIPDQFLDRTRNRISTFFGNGLAVHVSFAHPVCKVLGPIVAEAVEHTGTRVHRGGTYVCMEGPQFSTLAESKLYRSWGMDVVGMTNLQEAKLAREAEMCYVTMALVTDYDCWHPDHDQVTVDMIVATLTQNAKTAQHAIADAVGRIPAERGCECATALKFAIITRPDAIPTATKRDLAPIIGKYVS